MLTANQIVEKGIIFLTDEAKKKYKIENLSPAQAGIDLHIVSCSKLDESSHGFIFSDNEKDENGKTRKPQLPKAEDCRFYKTNDTDGFWHLNPGQYEIGFAEGCNFGETAVGKIVHRSSLRRCGAEINSPIWDPGFKTDEMGTFITVNHPIDIAMGARVAQMIVFETKEAAELYGTVEGKSHYQGTGVLKGNN